PFSRVKQTKQTLYRDLGALVDGAPKPTSVPQLLKQLSDVLRCPVALVGASGAVYADGEISADLSPTALADVHHMVVIGEVSGALHDFMHEHRLGAIAPLFPHSRSASSWLVFGNTFSERLYTPSDFATIERVTQQL